DRLADRQAQAHTALRSLALQAIELVEELLLLALGDARAAIGDFDRDAPGQYLRRDLDRRPARRVLGGVLEQIGQQLPDQHRIDVQQRQVRWQRDLDRMRRQRLAQPDQNAADYFLQRRPLPGEGNGPRFEAGHVQQV